MIYSLCISNYLCRICAASSRSCADSAEFVQRGKACVDGRFERFVIPCAVLCAICLVRARDKAQTQGLKKKSPDASQRPGLER